MTKQQIVYKQVGELKLNPRNPRKNDNAVDTVAKSIDRYGFKNPLIIDSNGTIWCGNTRFKAAKKLGLKELPCIVADDLTEEQIREYALLDNKTNEIADWDYDLLSEELAELDLDEFELDWGINQVVSENGIEKYSLKDLFIFNPFSVLDCRIGKWQERKKQWLSLGIKSELGRNDNLMKSPESSDYVEGTCSHFAPSTSIFDPVICELMYKWFNIENGVVYDCFAGGSVRGIVAQKLGYKYIGIDLRQEQVDANIANANEIGVNPIWYCDDSFNVDNYLQDESVDMIFSCPPYLDLEVYSDDKRDLSNMTYSDFVNAYTGIIQKSVNKLKPNRFAVFVVGDVRDKKGFYRDFISLTKKAFIDNGCLLYNEIIKIDPNGTAGLRARKTFENRKVVKVHQNILVFYKGEPKKIKDNFGKVEVPEDNSFDSDVDQDF